ncbi:MAG: GNAT family N-acetyltransferase [Hyphomicrobiales bacterium]
MKIRTPLPGELAELSALCLRSKAYWGYDEAFIEACREELTLTPDELSSTYLAVAEIDGAIAGLVQVGIEADEADLHKLFIDPEKIGAGIGRHLMDWGFEVARRAGARRMTIVADAGAVPFYERIGAYQIGDAPSDSIPGRKLPKLVCDLRDFSADT